MLLGVAVLYGSAALQASKSCQSDIRGHLESFGINMGYLHTGSNFEKIIFALRIPCTPLCHPTH